MFNRVAAFHTAFGHPVGAVPQLPDQVERDLRIKLIHEELDEYCIAYEEDDRIEMADALADLLFVLAGTAVSYGIAGGEHVESPYEDMEPLEGLSASFAGFLQEDFETYMRAESENNLVAIQSAIYHMIVEIFGIARQSRIPINAVFAEVCRSNLSKLMPDGSVLRRADGKILKGPNYSPPDIKSILENING